MGSPVLISRHRDTGGSHILTTPEAMQYWESIGPTCASIVSRAWSESLKAFDARKNPHRLLSASSRFFSGWQSAGASDIFITF